MAEKGDDLRIIKLCSSTSTTCGLLEMGYLAEKEKSNSKTHEVVRRTISHFGYFHNFLRFFLQFFFVLKGKPQFLVGKQKYDLTVESQIRVPAGVTYAIKNTQRALARLYYYTHLISVSTTDDS